MRAICVVLAVSGVRSGGQRMRARRNAGDVRRRRRAVLEVLRPAAAASATASRSIARMAGVRTSVRSSRRFSRFSIDQENSASSLAPDHATAALQRVEGAARGDQRVLLRGILVPGRQVLCAIRAISSRASSMNSVISSGSAACGERRPALLLRSAGAAPAASAPRPVRSRAASAARAGAVDHHASRVASPTGAHGRHGTRRARTRPRPATASALSSMYQGSARPACSVSM